ncbi:MAG TPA: hypothetical protein VD905_11495, partial [Flavobacteriales bacterium]|nr:hypothetical protein [Flavobacteriales bacterium]
MENFKFFTDRTPLTPGEIQAHKNFSKVLEQYKNIPVKFYKTGWFKAGLATVTVAATGTILFFATGPNKNNDDKQLAKTVTSPAPYHDETPCVKSPAPVLDVPAVNFTVNAGRDTVLMYETGSVLVYKANSLKNQDGSNVSGNVVIRYREFHNPVEIFASGIPMKYDSAGVDWHLKSAGMIEITAHQNGKPVFIAPEKPIDIKMKSDCTDGEYNVYFLDTNKRNWGFEGVDKTIAENKPDKNSKPVNPGKPPHTKEEIAKMKVDTVKIRKELASFLPAKPVAADPKAFTFTLDVLENEFPELKTYGNTRFEVIDKNRVFNAQMFNTEWEDIALKQVVAGSRYEMTLTRGNVKKVFDVMPVLEGKDLKLAQEQYSKKYKEYQNKFDSRVKEEKQKIAKEKEKLAQWEKLAAENHRIYNENLQVMNTTTASTDRFMNSTQQMVTRAFQVSKFGYWNCDNPRS